MGLNVFFVAVFFIQSIAAPATWAGDEDAPAQNPTPPDATPALTVNVSDSRGRLRPFDERMACELADRIIYTAPGAYSATDRMRVRDAIKKIAASLPLISDPEAHSLVMTNRRAILLQEIRHFRRLQEELNSGTTDTVPTAEALNAQAALVLRLLIELNLAAAATDFDAGVDTDLEAIDLHQQEQTLTRLDETRHTAGWSAFTMAALGAIAAIAGAMEVTFKSSAWAASSTMTSGWAFVSALVVLVGFGITHHKYVRLTSRAASDRKVKEARHPNAVYKMSLTHLTRDIAHFLRVTPIDGHPEIPVMTLLTEGTQLRTRTVLEGALLCQLKLDPFGHLALDQRPEPQTN